VEATAAICMEDSEDIWAAIPCSAEALRIVCVCKRAEDFFMNRSGPLYTIQIAVDF